MPNKYAVCIGIDSYPGTGADLQGCRNDAALWAEVLRDRGWTISLRTDPTREQLLESLLTAIARLRADDEIVVTYSGHGTRLTDRDGDELDGLDEAWCPSDVATAGPILDDEIHLILSTVPNRAHVTVISDSCNSGTVVRLASPPAAPGQVRAVRSLPWERVRQSPTARQLATGRAARLSDPVTFRGVLMAACQPHEQAYEGLTRDGRPGGIFTRVAIDMLGSVPITYRQWLTKIQQRLPSIHYPQSPRLDGSKLAAARYALA